MQSRASRGMYRARRCVPKITTPSYRLRSRSATAWGSASSRDSSSAFTTMRSAWNVRVAVIPAVPGRAPPPPATTRASLRVVRSGRAAVMARHAACVALTVAVDQVGEFSTGQSFTISSAVSAAGPYAYPAARPPGKESRAPGGPLATRRRRGQSTASTSRQPSCAAISLRWRTRRRTTRSPNGANVSAATAGLGIPVDAQQPPVGRRGSRRPRAAPIPTVHRPRGAWSGCRPANTVVQHGDVQALRFPPLDAHLAHRAEIRPSPRCRPRGCGAGVGVPHLDHRVDAHHDGNLDDRGVPRERGDQHTAHAVQRILGGVTEQQRLYARAARCDGQALRTRRGRPTRAGVDDRQGPARARSPDHRLLRGTAPGW